MKRCPFSAVVATSLLLLLAQPVSATSLVSLRDVRVTAAAPNELAAVEATIVNESDLPVTVVAIGTSATSRGMFHFSFNMCQPGSTMIRLPSIVIPVARSLTLSTKGSGAMVLTKQQGLRVGQHITVALTLRRGTRDSVVKSDAIVVARPKGLKRSYGGSIGTQ
jgi:copper(I)-binding protein